MRWTEQEELESQEVGALLEKAVRKISFDDAALYFIHGFPSSDIGKGNLVARLAGLRDDSSIIKFDGFLNTNFDGRYPSADRYDFMLYRKFNLLTDFGSSNHMIGGRLIYDFLREYGETSDHLTFSGHLAMYFVVDLFKRWTDIGRPDNLFVEVGGTSEDAELRSYALPGISRIKMLHRKAKSFLLADSGYGGEYIKSKLIQIGMRSALSAGIKYDTVFVRRPRGAPADRSIIAIEKYLETKLERALTYSGEAPRVILIPYYEDAEMEGYKEYLESRGAEIFW